MPECRKDEQSLCSLVKFCNLSIIFSAQLTETHHTTEGSVQQRENLLELYAVKPVFLWNGFPVPQH